MSGTEVKRNSCQCFAFDKISEESSCVRAFGHRECIRIVFRLGDHFLGLVRHLELVQSFPYYGFEHRHAVCQDLVEITKFSDICNLKITLE